MTEPTNQTERPEDTVRRLARENVSLGEKWCTVMEEKEKLFESYALETERNSELTTENYKLMQALREIAADTDEAGAVRVAIDAICTCKNGPSFLVLNPLA